MNAKALLPLCLVVVACGRLSSDAEEAADAVETTESTSSEGALMDLTAVEGPTCGLTAEVVAQKAEERARARLKDPSCVSVARAGNEADYTFTSCTGQWGKLNVTGKVHVVYTVNTDCSVDAVATGTGITVNKATVDLDATAHYTRSSEGVEKIVVATHTKGGNDNVQLDHSGSYTVTRDSSSGTLCRSLEGNWSTDWSAARGNATTSTVATGLSKCGDACPAAGGKVVHEGLLGRVITVTFDGTNIAKWESSKGKSGTVELSCGE